MSHQIVMAKAKLINHNLTLGPFIAPDSQIILPVLLASAHFFRS